MYALHNKHEVSGDNVGGSHCQLRWGLARAVRERYSISESSAVDRLQSICCCALIYNAPMGSSLVVCCSPH